jgi:hypothetical protein
MQVEGKLPIGQQKGDVVIQSLTANIGQFKHCNSLVHFFLWGANIFTLDSNEHYFPSRNCALPQDSHSLGINSWSVDSINHTYLLATQWQHSTLLHWKFYDFPEGICKQVCVEHCFRNDSHISVLWLQKLSVWQPVCSTGWNSRWCDDDHVVWVRLHLWTAVTNELNVHFPGDIWARRTVVDWLCRYRKTDPHTRALLTIVPAVIW